MEQPQLNPQSGMNQGSKDNSQELSQKEKQDQKELTFVDFVRPEFLIGSLLRGAKLSKLPKTLKLILQALLYMGISALALSLLFGGELPDWLRPGSRLVDLVITILIFCAVLWYSKNKIDFWSMQNKSRILVIVVGILALILIGAGVFYATRFASFFPNKESAKQAETLKDETADWKTYRNEDFGFTLKIPSEWSNYVVDKEVRPAGSEFSTASGKGSGFPWTIYNLGIKGKNLGYSYSSEQTYNLLTIIIFEPSDAQKLNIQSEVENTFPLYKIVPTATEYFVLYRGACQDCNDREPLTELRKKTNDVMETFQPGGSTNWKTYRNEEFGFEFRYPPEYAIGVSTEPGTVFLALPSGLDLEKHTEWRDGSYTADKVFEQVRFGRDMPYEIDEKPLLATYAIPNFASPRYLVRVLANGSGTDFVSVQMRTDKLDQFLKETDLLFSEFKFLK